MKYGFGQVVQRLWTSCTEASDKLYGGLFLLTYDLLAIEDDDATKAPVHSLS